MSLNQPFGLSLPPVLGPDYDPAYFVPPSEDPAYDAKSRKWYAEFLDGVTIPRELNKFRSPDDVRQARSETSHWDLTQTLNGGAGLQASGSTDVAGSSSGSLTSARAWLQDFLRSGELETPRMFSAAEAALKLPACWKLFQHLVASGILVADVEAWRKQLNGTSAELVGTKFLVDARCVWLLTPVVWREWAIEAIDTMNNMRQAMTDPEDLDLAIKNFADTVRGTTEASKIETGRFNYFRMAGPILELQPRPMMDRRTAPREETHEEARKELEAREAFAAGNWKSLAAGMTSDVAAASNPSFGDMTLPDISEIPGGIYGNSLSVREGFIDTNQIDKDIEGESGTAFANRTWLPHMIDSQYLKLGMESGIWHKDPRSLGGEEAVARAAQQASIMTSNFDDTLWGAHPVFARD